MGFIQGKVEPMIDGKTVMQNWEIFKVDTQTQKGKGWESNPVFPN